MQKEKNQHTAVDSGVHSTKKQALEEIGLTERQANRFETLAKHPEVVEQAKADAQKRLSPFRSISRHSEKHLLKIILSHY